MKNNLVIKAVICGIIIIFGGASFIPSVISGETRITPFVSSMNATLIVDDEGDGDFTTIQDAITNASSGDSIDVYSGIYMENLEIEKEIVLTGIDSEYMNGGDNGKPVIDGDYKDDVITIFTDGENAPISISGFVIQNSGYRDSGIFVDFSVDIEISENVITNNHHGIYVYHSCITIEENIISNNDWGILAEFSNHCIITENEMIQNNIGLQLESSHELTINRNVFENNSEFGIILIRSPVNDISYNNFIDNNRNAWFKNCINQWNDNYWGNRILNLPIYIIIGTFQFSIIPSLFIPMFQFDFRAKSTPN
ncbi:MAG: right-handed parallel beta-helix repeat-containing protein [Thermoplasmatales archaeon]|nr:MAG: right-handed parallel beta-helix repeat-containing protein [Thermoplasmatales archaeon]